MSELADDFACISSHLEYAINYFQAASMIGLPRTWAVLDIFSLGKMLMLCIIL